MQLGSIGIQDGDVSQVAVQLLVIQAAADHEAVRNFETAEIDRHLCDAPDGTVEQSANSDRSRSAACKRLQQIARRQAGVDNVFNKQDVFVLDGVVKIFSDAHHSRRLSSET